MRHYYLAMLVVVGCGGNGGAVTLTVLRNGGPVAGVHTYFLDADNSHVATLDTDAMGTASANMVAGGSVTAIDPFPAAGVTSPVPIGNNDLRTFMGVEPGDHLVLTQTDSQPITFTLRAPAVATASAYDVVTTCGAASIASGSAPSGRITLYDCRGTADIVIVARATINGVNNPLSALYHPNVALTEGGTVDLTTDTYQPLTGMVFSYLNAPNTTLTVSHTLVSARGKLTPFVADVGGKPTTIQEPAIPEAIGMVDTKVLFNGQHHVVDGGVVAATYALDLNNVLLPDLIGGPSYDAMTQRLAWTEDTAGVAPDLTTTAIEVTRNDGSRRWHWSIAAPYTPGELRLPVLPTEVADWTPSASLDSVKVTALANAKVPGGYDAVRAHVHEVRDASGFVAGQTGRVVTVEAR